MPTAKKTSRQVRVGQLWKDWDSRVRNSEPIYKRVVSIDGKYATVKSYRVTDSTVRMSKIRLDRFQPTHNGYKYVRG
jgi:hypothetical protein